MSKLGRLRNQGIDKCQEDRERYALGPVRWSRDVSCPERSSTVVVGSPRRARATVFHLLVAAVLAGCGGPGQPTVPVARVTIGLLAPATGSGIEALRGAQLAVDVINHSYPDLPVPLAAGSGLPGLAGRSVALVSGPVAMIVTALVRTAAALLKIPMRRRLPVRCWSPRGILPDPPPGHPSSSGRSS